MSLRIVQVDAFTPTAFGGNPAAVCVLAGAADEKWMSSVAREMNLSETAFLYPENDGYHLRWFTPAVEVDLCGHATLGTAHVLWTEGHLRTDETAKFYTKSGILTCERRGDWIEMNFPATRQDQIQPPALLSEALGAPFQYAGKTTFDYLVQVADEKTLRELKPNYHLLRELPARGIIVTASSSGEFDFVSRFFAPASGIDEDPVTGSAHCALAPFWAAKLRKSEMTAYQASARGGVVKVRLEGDRVVLIGQAVTVLRGELMA